MNGPIVAFTGHRPQKLGGFTVATFEWISFLIEQELIQLCPRWCISGMALGVDQWGALVALSMGIPVTAAIPFKGQELVWKPRAQWLYRELLEEVDEVVVVSPGEYAPWKMQRRNEYMVDRCDILLAVWDGTPGGTANCVRYAERKGKEIVRINPVL